MYLIIINMNWINKAAGNYAGDYYSSILLKPLKTDQRTLIKQSIINIDGMHCITAIIKWSCIVINYHFKGYGLRKLLKVKGSLC